MPTDDSTEKKKRDAIVALAGVAAAFPPDVSFAPELREELEAEGWEVPDDDQD